MEVEGAKPIRSQAFQDALLKSERLRIMAASCMIAGFGAIAVVRIYLFGSHMSHIAVYGAVAMLAYELLVLRTVTRSSDSGVQIPNWFWIINVVIEISLPAVGLTFLANEHIAADYRALATPWVLLFFPFLVLSALRLSPLLSTIAGLAGATGFLIAASHHGWHIKPDLLTNPVTHSEVPLFAVMIFATGVIAAVVAREIRTQVQAALREAETEQQKKQLEHDLTIARSIQRSLLPKTRPNIEGFEIAGWNRSADATGGDYFDWKQLDDGRVIVTLADVTGHGIGPALLASVCRAYARATLTDSEALTRCVQRINSYLGEDLSPGRFATFVAAACRAGDNKIELVSAGHAPLFWYSRATDELRDFPAHDVPLGIVPALRIQSPQVLAMQDGDVILLVTDGFLEWENKAGEQFGSVRFAEAIRGVADRTPDAIISELYSRVLGFAEGTPQQDDLTAVVIKRKAA